MPISEIIKVLSEDIEEEVKNIISSAEEERNKIINSQKSQIDEEFENKKKEISTEIEKSLLLHKLSIESENRRKVNENFSKTFEEIYKDVVKKVKQTLISIKEKEDITLSIFEKVINNLPNDIDKSNVEVMLSKDDFERFSSKIESFLKSKKINPKILSSDIEGGIIIKIGKIRIDNSLDRIITMFKPSIVNLIYKNLPKAGY